MGFVAVAFAETPNSRDNVRTKTSPVQESDPQICSVHRQDSDKVKASPQAEKGIENVCISIYHQRYSIDAPETQYVSWISFLDSDM